MLGSIRRWVLFTSIFWSIQSGSGSQDPDNVEVAPVEPPPPVGDPRLLHRVHEPLRFRRGLRRPTHRGFDAVKDEFRGELQEEFRSGQHLPATPDHQHHPEEVYTRSNSWHSDLPPGVDITDLPQIPLGLHVNLSAFGGPNGIKASHYSTVKIFARPFQIFSDILGGGDVLCVVWPSSCKKSRRQRRSPWRRRRFRRRYRFSTQRRRRPRVTSHGKRAPASRRANSPDNRVSPSHNSNSESPHAPVAEGSTTSRRHVSLGNVETIFSIGNELVRTGVDTVERIFDISNDQYDRYGISEDEYEDASDYDDEAPLLSDSFPQTNVTRPSNGTHSRPSSSTNVPSTRKNVRPSVTTLKPEASRNSRPSVSSRG